MTQKNSLFQPKRTIPRTKLKLIDKQSANLDPIPFIPLPMPLAAPKPWYHEHYLRRKPKMEGAPQIILCKRETARRSRSTLQNYTQSGNSPLVDRVRRNFVPLVMQLGSKERLLRGSGHRIARPNPSHNSSLSMLIHRRSESSQP